MLQAIQYVSVTRALSQVPGPLLSSLLACPHDSPSWARLKHHDAHLTANSGNLQEQEEVGPDGW